MGDSLTFNGDKIADGDVSEFVFDISTIVALAVCVDSSLLLVALILLGDNKADNLNENKRKYFLLFLALAEERTQDLCLVFAA